MPHGIQRMNACRLQQPVTQWRFHSQTIQSFGYLFPFGCRQVIIDRIISNGRQVCFMCHSQISTPYRLTGKHFTASPSVSLYRLQQNLFQFAGIPFITRHQVSQWQIIGFVQAFPLQFFFGYLPDIFPSLCQFRLILHTLFYRFNPFRRIEQRRMLHLLCKSYGCTTQDAYNQCNTFLFHFRFFLIIYLFFNECPYFTQLPCRGVSHTPWKHSRGLVDAFGRMRYAPTWAVCGCSFNY